MTREEFQARVAGMVAEMQELFAAIDASPELDIMTAVVIAQEVIADTLGEPAAEAFLKGASLGLESEVVDAEYAEDLGSNDDVVADLEEDLAAAESEVEALEDENAVLREQLDAEGCLEWYELESGGWTATVTFRAVRNGQAVMARRKYVVVSGGEPVDVWDAGYIDDPVPGVEHAVTPFRDGQGKGLEELMALCEADAEGLLRG